MPMSRYVYIMYVCMHYIKALLHWDIYSIPIQKRRLTLMKIIKIYMDRVQAMEPPSRIMGVVEDVTCKYVCHLSICV